MKKNFEELDFEEMPFEDKKEALLALYEELYESYADIWTHRVQAALIYLMKNEKMEKEVANLKEKFRDDICVVHKKVMENMVADIMHTAREYRIFLDDD